MRRLVAVFISFILVLSCSITCFASFSDISEHWAKGPIEKLIEENIIGGYPDGTFRPNNHVKISEFIVLVLKASEIPIKQSSGKWWQGAVDTAMEYGIVYKGEFSDYDKQINQGQMARMIVRALNEKPSGENTDFIDDNSILSRIKGFVKKVNTLEIMGGYPDSTFRYSGNATRAEAAVVLTKMRDIQKANNVKPVPIPQPIPQPVPAPPASSDVPARLYNYSGGTPIKDSELRSKVVQQSKEFVPVLFGRNYKNTTGYKDKMKYYVAGDRIWNGVKYTASEWMDAWIKDGKDKEIIMEARFITNDDLAFMHDGSPVVRGTCQFKYISHNKLPSGMKLNQWYEQDYEIRWYRPAVGADVTWDFATYVFDEYVILNSRSEMK